MNPLTPIKRRDFIRKIRNVGFEGPYIGKKHQFMVYQPYRLTLPSNEDFSIPQLKMLIKEIESILQKNITNDEWFLL
jgi:hypothetical protein